MDAADQDRMVAAVSTMGTPTENGYVRVKVERAVAVLTVDRPPANALDRQLVDQLSRAATSLVRRGDVGAVVITSTRSRFIAGADIKMLRGLDDSLFPRFVSAIQRGFDDLQRLPMPRIAAVNGPAVGGGLELALACDPQFVAEGTRLGLPEVRLRLLPGAGGTQRLVEAVGKGPTLELLYTGRGGHPRRGVASRASRSNGAGGTCDRLADLGGAGRGPCRRSVRTARSAHWCSPEPQAVSRRAGT
ncbi:enoyl-CoA hydratase-related protein [Prauserella muralis]|uniref:Uncharacterized protein n=1 Tax=Prauserella muralis TaxID=588067 RepID=A0A2V4AFD1_9PSEU|nr:enoyl-CoA hydratase-related protein [Prauserella muralis]PXY17382.1 hypothetical protein BAY60_34385 [Prauserella muralis]TWE23546.1 enoyl-CoA hydratase/isomerase-like protein [Prauserella muralis]